MVPADDPCCPETGTNRAEDFRVCCPQKLTCCDGDPSGPGQQPGVPVSQRLDAWFGLDLVGVDDWEQVLWFESPGVEQLPKRPGDFVTTTRTFHHLAPPVQPDQRQMRLGGDVSCTAQFMVEGI